jgi:hypothetical protein
MNVTLNRKPSRPLSEGILSVLSFTLAGFLTVLPGGASDAFGGENYSAQLQRIRANEGAISDQLRHLRSRYGFAADTLGTSATEKSAPQDRPKLLALHNELRSGYLPAGKLLFGKTLMRLVVTSEAAPLLVTLDDGQGAVSGVRVLGVARPSSIPGRVQVELQKLLLSSRSVAIQGSALDPEGALGLVAEVFSSKAWSIAGAMAGSFITGLATGQQTQSVSALGFSQAQPTGRNALLQGVAQTAADQSKRLIEEATAEKPVLVVESGMEVVLLIQEEVRF